MGKRSSKKKEHDFAVTAFRVVQEATKEAEETPPMAEVTEPPSGGKNSAAVALGRLGGKKGGVVRAQNLTPEKRREIAQTLQE